MGYVATGTTTVHICPECNHKSSEHSRNPSAESCCSYTWCPCRRTPEQVQAVAPPETRDTYQFTGDLR